MLLDNAVGADQVLLLLPAGPTNLVLIASRRSTAPAQTFPLDVFSSTERSS
ncbi:hypothetical protein [Nocardia vinacea]|uniref:hypothetical protein n=1 Tax=Nocardia vinacea TaxID=96468 RepID=UPI0002F22F3D|nr:hypothetical protein [Nocardia vinacea]